ncbi:MAG: hypothetical protein M5U26_04370 [Planctomycetota bacterium]|nr:hypothetical protein [Planctomycetota bacterium]
MRNALLFAADLPPLPGLPTRSGGMRAHQLARLLEASGYRVRVSCPLEGSLEPGQLKRVPAEFLELCHRRRTQAEICRELKPDLVVFASSWIVLTGAWVPEPPVLIDLCGPMIVESALNFGAGPEAVANLLRRKLAVLSHGDWFLCAGRRQQWYFRQALVMAGIGLDGPTPLSVLPFGADPEWIVERDYPAEPRFVYAGGLYPWQDPEPAILAILERLEARGRGRFEWIGGLTRFADRALAERYERLGARIEASPRASRRGHLPLDELLPVLRGMSVAVEWMRPNAERELAVPARTPLNLAMGLPVLANDYAEAAEDLRAAGAGWALDAADPRALPRAVDEVLDDPARVERMGRDALALARRLAWPPLDEAARAFLLRPAPREGKRPQPLERAFPPMTPGELAVLRALRSAPLQLLRRALGPCYRLFTGSARKD